MGKLRNRIPALVFSVVSALGLILLGATAGADTTGASNLVARCDYHNGFLCINVKGDRGQWVIAGATYKQENGPERLGQLCYQTPGSGWNCNGGNVFRPGADYSFAFGTQIKPGCYRAALGFGSTYVATACLNK